MLRRVTGLDCVAVDGKWLAPATPAEGQDGHRLALATAAGIRVSLFIDPDPVAIERMGGDGNLTFQERAVLEAIDGERSIREIVGNMGGSSFDLCKIVYQFLHSRLVRRKAA